MDEERIEIDSENYRNTEKYGYKDIVLRQVQRVVSNLSKEQREGFWIYSDNPNAPAQRIKYIGDARDETIQSIETLYDLLLPRFDKQIKEETKDFEANLEAELKIIREKHKIERDDKERSRLVTQSWKTKLRNYRNLFQQLCLFLERLGWFEAGSLEDSD